MFPSLQPSRPKVPPPSSAPHLNPQALGQQQIRHSQSSQSSIEARPGSQIEAMPPYPPLTSHPPPFNILDPRILSPQSPLHVQQMQMCAQMATHAPYNSAMRHPVFFTEQLRKPPFPLPDVGGRGIAPFNPVAQGYIFEQKRVAPTTKL